MGLISLTGVNFSRRVTASSTHGSLALGRRFFLLEAWGRARLLGRWLGFPGLWALDSLSACRFTGCTERVSGGHRENTVLELQIWVFHNSAHCPAGSLCHRHLYAGFLNLPFQLTPAPPSELHTHRANLQMDIWAETGNRHLKHNTSQTKPPAPRQLPLSLHLGFLAQHSE